MNILEIMGLVFLGLIAIGLITLLIEAKNAPIYDEETNRYYSEVDYEILIKEREEEKN